MTKNTRPNRGRGPTTKLLFTNQLSLYLGEHDPVATGTKTHLHMKKSENALNGDFLTRVILTIKWDYPPSI